MKDEVSGRTAEELAAGISWCAEPVALFENDSAPDRSRLAFGDVTGDDVGDILVGRSDGSVSVLVGVNVASPSIAFTIVPEHPDISFGEAVNATNLVWSSGGAAAWTSQWDTASFDGSHAARSGAIGHVANSWIETSVDGCGILTYAWRASTEARYDMLQFIVDGEVLGTLSGETGWMTNVVKLGEGVHVVRWNYRKSRSKVGGADTVWLDAVIWTPTGFTLTTEVPVPHAEIRTLYGRYLAEAGGDYERAANMTGRNGVPIWQSYVAGLDPEDEDSKFVAKIEMKDGTPVITWEPDDPTLRATRDYTTYGKKSLTDSIWTPVTDADTSAYQFFKVEVRLK